MQKNTVTSMHMCGATQRLIDIGTMQVLRGPALSIQIVNFLIEFVGALYCFLHFTEFFQKYP